MRKRLLRSVALAGLVASPFWAQEQKSQPDMPGRDMPGQSVPAQQKSQDVANADSSDMHDMPAWAAKAAPCGPWKATTWIWVRI